MSIPIGQNFTCTVTGKVVNRQRVDDHLSARILTRHKDGGRTLVLRSELEAQVKNVTHDGRRRR